MPKQWTVRVENDDLRFIGPAGQSFTAEELADFVDSQESTIKDLECGSRAQRHQIVDQRATIEELVETSAANERRANRFAEMAADYRAELRKQRLQIDTAVAALVGRE